MCSVSLHNTFVVDHVKTADYCTVTELEAVFGRSVEKVAYVKATFHDKVYFICVVKLLINNFLSSKMSGFKFLQKVYHETLVGFRILIKQWIFLELPFYFSH